MHDEDRSAIDPRSDAYSRERRGGALLRGLLRDPFLHFVLIGCATFLGVQYWQNMQERYTIVISDGDIRSIAATYAQRFGASPSPERLHHLIDQHVRTEVLYREGLALGLNRDDEVVRRRVVQKFRFLLQDRDVIDDIATEDLQAFYRRNQDLYTAPARVSFSHIYFSSDQSGVADPKARAIETLGKLRSLNADRSPSMGDRFWGRYDYSAVDKVGVDRLFGASRFADALFDVPLDRWMGPFRSGFGWHLIRVSARQEPRMPPLAEVRDRVARDYEESVRQRKNAEAFAALRRQYTVVVPVMTHD